MSTSNSIQGLPNVTILKAVFNHILPGITISETSKLMSFQEYIAVLTKFRLNSNSQDLSYCFGVSVAAYQELY